MDHTDRASADVHEPPPTKLYVELTTECNLDCRMCMRRSWEEPGGRMDPDLFARLVRQVRDVPGLATIQLSGFGEPTCHPQWLDFVTQAKRAGLRVEVVTNGTTLAGQTPERLIALGLDRLIVSLDGLGTTHDTMRCGSSAAEVVDNLRTFHRWRLAQGVRRPEVAIEFVATKRNIHELPAIKRLGPELGLTGIVVTNLIPYTRELADDILYDRWTTASRARTPSPWHPVVDLPLMDARSSAGPVLNTLLDSGTLLRVRGTDAFSTGPDCRFVTQGRLVVAWDGSVSPCLALMHTYTYYFRGRARRVRAYRVGHVGQSTLRAIWADPAYRAFRQRVRRFEFSPCIDCGGCELRETNEEDCFGDTFPRCGECLWAAGLVQCP